jgi:hypothetical protein
VCVRACVRARVRVRACVWGVCVRARAQDADEGEVKKAYKRAALKFHPDKWANATEVRTLDPGL